MGMPGRKYQTGSESYRYSINGQEKDKELNENVTTALYWEYDSRIGRRWNLDPKPTVGIGGYSCFGNNPIFNNDIKGDTPRVKMGDSFYTLVLNKENKLTYVDSKGNDYNGPLTRNAQSVLTTTANSLKSKSEILAGRANTVLNSKFDLFITEDNFELTGKHGEGFDALYAYKLSDGSVKSALNSEAQPSNAIGAYISLTGFMGSNPVAREGTDIRYSPGKLIRDLGAPADLTTVHEIFAHGWQAINKMLGPEKVQNWSGGTLLGAPTKTEADAITIRNLYALHNGLWRFVQTYSAEGQGFKTPTYNKVPWGYLLGNQNHNGALQNYPEPK